ncbi:precorrin-2 C(20)-methyltransferase [Sulfodiicoccus acidiphilus]|uniref:Precorrin-2 C(20)-methyltransferase n=1 Tax=Sulfodiicoccus acidiphilus TaxID=1670455 RepID=A0A348B2N0_9CREN|nr:cobalt-factor II C(20)-methyltransferase [Sulfodiicoccus acidiphilus]BBD72432.1 precorrin-2 C(20)-methyltransferase [Sulfodiicoccus acidiphilus]GGT97171.1 precorrin-2 C(20)-methyltransferase [Sulfodiicoccus acidiphilus]
MKLYVLGLGPGDPKLLTVRAVEVLSQVRVIFVPYSTGTNRSLALEVISPYIQPRTQLKFLGFPMGRTVKTESLQQLARELEEGLKVSGVGAFVTLGDPTLYSTYFRLADFLANVEVELIPGVSSITACACRLNLPLAMGDQVVLLVPAAKARELNTLELVDTVVILKGNEDLGDIASSLAREFDLFYARRCYMTEEVLKKWDGTHERDYFSMLIGVRHRER